MPLADDVMKKLLSASEMDPDSSTGRLFAYIYETGREDLARAAREAYSLFINTNALDPLVFKSALYFEREIVGWARRLAGGSEEVVGTVTSGGTESIILAVKTARSHFEKREGRSAVGEVVAPATIHPSVKKASHYTGLRYIESRVERDTKKARVEDLKENVSNKTALIVLSAPNYPYGTIDPVKDAAEYAADKGIPVHVDACLGGYILPFFERLGIDVPEFDFRIEGVTSISMDAHKYGYAPKGVSVLLFRDAGWKKESIFVDLAWPGYPFINTAVLSSRSIAPLAAAWAIQSLLGENGYLELASHVVEARDAIYSGLSRLGFESLAPIESPILSLTHQSGESEVLKFHAVMSERGWVIGLQPRVKNLAPLNIHLTMMPVHKRIVGEFLRDAEEALSSGVPEDLRALLSQLERDPLAAALKIGETKFDAILIAKLLESLPEDLASEMAKELAVEVFKP